MAAAPGRRRAALLVRCMALFVCAAAILAHAQTIKVVASNAQGISDAFQQLSRAYNSTTRPGTVTLELNLTCYSSIEDFNLTNPAMADFIAGVAPTKNGKQPKVKIMIASDTPCRGDFFSRPNIISNFDHADLCAFNIDKDKFPNTSVDITLIGLDYIAAAGQRMICFYAHEGTGSTFTMIDSVTESGAVRVDGAATVAITGRIWNAETNGPILDLSRISKTVAIKNALFFIRNMTNDTTSVVTSPLSITNLGPGAKVTLTSNDFYVHSVTDYAPSKALLIEYQSTGAVTLTRNKFYAGKGFAGEVMTGVCIHTLAAGARPKLSLARSPASDEIPGSQGLWPTKAPWPVSDKCNVAELVPVLVQDIIYERSLHQKAGSVITKVTPTPPGPL